MVQLSAILKNFYHVSNKGLSLRAKKNLAEDFIKDDKFLLILVILYWAVLSPLGGAEHGYYMLGFVGGGILIANLLISFYFYRSTYIFRIMIGFTSAAISAVHIQQELGTMNSHLLYFMSVCVVMMYRDVFAATASLLTIIINHAVGVYCQLEGIQIAGVPIVMFNWGGWDVFISHLVWTMMSLVIVSIVAYEGMNGFFSSEKHLYDMEQLNKGLDRLVEERSKKLKSTINEIKTIFSNVSDGIFTILSDNSIHHDYSASLKDILQTDTIENIEPANLLFKHSNEEKNIESINSIISSVLGSHIDSFNALKERLPQEIKRTVDKVDKLLAIDWVAVQDRKKKINRILVQVTDVTEMRQLEQEREAKEIELKMIIELISIKPNDFFEFYHSSMLACDQCLEKQPSDSSKKAIKFDLKPIIGHARKLGLNHKNFDSVISNNDSFAAINEFKNYLIEYNFLAQNKLNWKESKEDDVKLTIDKKDFTSLVEKVHKIDFDSFQADDIKQFLAYFKKTFAANNQLLNS